MSVDCGSTIVTSCIDGAAGFNRAFSQLIQQSELANSSALKRLRVGQSGLNFRFPVFRKAAGGAFWLVQVCKTYAISCACGELKRLRASAHAASAARQIKPEQRPLACSRPHFLSRIFSAPRNSPLCFIFRAGAVAVSPWLYFRAKHWPPSAPSRMRRGWGVEEMVSMRNRKQCRGQHLIEISHKRTKREGRCGERCV